MVKRYERFSVAISKISQCIQKIEAEEMAKYGLAGSCAQYLAILGGSDCGLTISRLSEICMKDKAAVSRAVASLEKNGMVKRNVQGKNLYRAEIVLTEKGREVSVYVAQKAATAVEAAGIDKDKREKMYYALDIVADNLAKICKEGLSD